MAEGAAEDPAGRPPGGGDEVPVGAASPAKAVVLALLLAVCVLVVWLLRDSVAPLREFRRPPWIDDLRRAMDDAGWGGRAAFVAGGAAAIAVGVPRLAVAFVGGAIAGWIEGTVLTMAATFVGCWATFAGGRALGREWMRSVVARRLPRSRALLDFLARHGFAANVALRLTPVGHALLTNLLFAMSDVGTGRFLAATLVGTFPLTLAVALVGSAAKGTDVVPRILGGAAAILVTALLVAWWTRRMRRRARADA